LVLFASCVTRSAAVVCVILSLLSAPLGAQTSQEERKVGNEPAGTDLAKKVANAFTQPLHPVVNGVASGGGVGAGVGYDFPQWGSWATSTEALLTVNGFWSTAITSTRKTARSRVVAYGRVRDMDSLSFYGPGTNSTAGDRTLFSFRDSSVGLVGSLDLSRWFTAGARVEQLWPDVSGESSLRVPAIGARFGEPQAPGIGDQPNFGRYHAFVDLESDAQRPGMPYQGGTTRVGYGLYDDQQFDRYSFRRFELETKHRFSVLGPHRLLTLHGWLSTTETSGGHDVPFFLQHTLGGKGNLRSVDESLLGTDGTDATLRGFRTFRFRDRHLLLLQAEYRWPIWGPIDATVFFDTGKVTSRRRDLNFSDLKRSYGFSIGAVRGANTVLRMDVGFGGGEGTHVFFTVGRVM
jgi:hypothetical protein